MGLIKYDLYLDESGNFSDPNLNKSLTPSLVGGILCPSSKVTDAIVNKMIPGRIHAMEEYRKDEFFGIINSLLQLGGRIVLFENNDRVYILDGDTTYLNIITEGLTKLLRDLHNDNPQSNIDINILIATRQNSDEREKNNNKVRILEEEYLRRFEEKMFVALGRNKIDGVSFHISFDVADINKRLMFADVICNTWLTRTAKKKFSDEDREIINTLYADCIRYEVYEDPDAGYLRRLISENRIGEAIAQLCVQKKMTKNLLDVRDLLIERISLEFAQERELYFSYISLKMAQFNQRRDYLAGIQFAEKYEEILLTPLLGIINKKDDLEAVEYWMFDTDFYLLTMYDHIGNADKCTEYDHRCNARIGIICHSWEHIDYYFNFRIRELNKMIGQFDFENVLIQSEPLISALQATKELFSMIDPQQENNNNLRSELLGKVYGVRLEAFTNLLPDHPEYLEKAVEVSDLAINEFIKPYDIHRQYQYRCLMYVTAGKADEALESLLAAYELKFSEDVFAQFIDKAFSGPRLDIFALFHYTNVMFLLRQGNDPRAQRMKEVLMSNQRFANELKAPIKDDYPWNLILWNIGRYYRLEGNSQKAANEYISRALAMTIKHTQKVTMYSFAVCIAADKLAWAIEHNPQEEKGARKEFDSICAFFKSMTNNLTIRSWLFVDNPITTIKEAKCIVSHILR